MGKKIKENKIAKILKTGSLIFLGLGLVGSLVMAEESQTVLKKTSSYSRYDDDAFETTTKFNASTFLGSAMAVTAASGLVYGFGELIQLQSSNNQMLRILITKKKDEVAEDEKAA